ncbi:MAG: ADP-ribosylglycohydrolase family protein [Actinobacteria bacterium]|nr:ADP-ribosylglycohydrolase family protein [Actinomycetota bacterium]
MRVALTDRLTGVLVAASCGDALGAGYEFGEPLAESEPVLMRGQGPFLPGEWTDDTAQMIAVAMSAADGWDLTSEEGQDQVAAHLLDWYYSPARLKDIGIHSSAVFARAATVEGPGQARRFREVAQAKERREPHTSGGNGALMRTAPVAMAMWTEPARMVKAALEIGALTHADDRSSESCAVWCLAIRAALLTSDPTDVTGLAASIDADLGAYLSAEAAAYWRDVLHESCGSRPADYCHSRPGNGYCVTTVRAAWAAITSTPVPSALPAHHLRRALEAAVRGGGDTDTVACVAGALLGALWGQSAVPLAWRRRVFGWPGMVDRDLVELTARIGGGRDGVWPLSDHRDYGGWPFTDALATHPFDDGVVMGGIDAAVGFVPIPGDPIDAVVSLCMVGRTDLDHFGLGRGRHVEVRLIDRVGANPHLQAVVDDAADAIAQFRAEGSRVLLHCVAAQSRTPGVAARYAVRHLGVDPEAALAAVRAVLPNASPNPELAASVRGL